MMIFALVAVALAAFFAGRTSAPSAALVGTTPAPNPWIDRPGARVTLALGAPYALIARTTGPLSPTDRERLFELLTLGAFHARSVSILSLPTHAELRMTFLSPRTCTLTIGQPGNWDLGDGRVQLVVRAIRRLDGQPIAAPITIGAKGPKSPLLAKLTKEARADIASHRVLGRPTGPVLSRTTARALELERSGLVRPSDVEALFDALHAETVGAEPWIHDAIRNPGALHRDLGIPEDETIPDELVENAARQPGTLGRRARLALTLRSFRH